MARRRREGSVRQERIVCMRCGKEVVLPSHLEAALGSCYWCARQQSVRKYLRRAGPWRPLSAGGKGDAGATSLLAPP